MQVAHDVDGTSENLGSSVGKSTGVHRLNMASKCFPEHGYLMVIALVRYPNIGSDTTLPIVKYHPCDDTVIKEVRSDPRVDLVIKDREWNLTDFNTKSSASTSNKHYAAPGDSYRQMHHRCSNDFETVPGTTTSRQGFPVGVPDDSTAYKNWAHTNDDIDMFTSREFQDWRIQGELKCNRRSVVSSQTEAHMQGTLD